MKALLVLSNQVHLSEIAVLLKMVTWRFETNVLISFQQC